MATSEIDKKPYILYVDNDGNVYPLEIPNGFIKTGMLASGVVTGGKISNGEISYAKLDASLKSTIDGKASAASVEALQQILVMEQSSTVADIMDVKEGYTVTTAEMMRFGYVYLVKLTAKGFGNSTSTDYIPATLKAPYRPAFITFGLHTSKALDYAYIASNGDVHVRFATAASSTTTSFNLEFVFLNVPAQS